MEIELDYDEDDEIGDDIGEVRVLRIVSGGSDVSALPKRFYQYPAGVVDTAAVVDVINAIADPSARRQAADALRERLLGVGDRPREHPPYLFIRSDGYLEAQQH